MSRTNWLLVSVVGLFFICILVGLWYLLFISKIFTSSDFETVTDFNECVTQGGEVSNTNSLARCFIANKVFTKQDEVDTKNTPLFDENDLTFVVGPGYKKCMGVVEQLCLEIDGQLFYDEIQGFDFLPGYIYKIIVRRDEAQNPAVDAPAYSYVLQRVLSQTKVEGDFTPPKINKQELVGQVAETQDVESIEIIDLVVGDSLVKCNRLDGLDCMVVDDETVEYDIRGFVFNPGLIQEIRVEKTDRFFGKDVKVLDIDRYSYRLLKTLGTYSAAQYEEKKQNEIDSATSTSSTTQNSGELVNSASTDDVTKREQDGCVISGCSSQLCVSAEEAKNTVSNCAYLDFYACYAAATCARQSSGKCGWTVSSELLQCIDSRR